MQLIFQPFKIVLIPISILDVIDILFVTYILFKLFKTIRGSSSFSIFLVILFIYILWMLVKALGMELTTSLVGQVMSVGVVALIIVFQQEIRRFLLIIGNRYIKNSRFTFKKIFRIQQPENDNGSVIVNEIVKACEDMSAAKTGALIVVGRMSSLKYFTDSGEIINAKVTAGLLETIFFKNTPLHDGAVLIENGQILAARCPLPSTDRSNLPAQMGMRHRAAIGMSEHTDALVVVVSEETGHISIADGGILKEDLSGVQLQNTLLTEKIWEI